MSQSGVGPRARETAISQSSSARSIPVRHFGRFLEPAARACWNLASARLFSSLPLALVDDDIRPETDVTLNASPLGSGSQVLVTDRKSTRLNSSHRCIS